MDRATSFLLPSPFSADFSLVRLVNSALQRSKATPTLVTTSSTVTVTTTAAAAKLSLSPQHVYFAHWTAELGLFFSVVLLGAPKGRRARGMFLCLMLCLLVSVPGCGGRAPTQLLLLRHRWSALRPEAMTLLSPRRAARLCPAQGLRSPCNSDCQADSWRNPSQRGTSSSGVRFTRGIIH
jgi:hypothetical protein